MITFLFEVNPVSFDQKQFSNFAQQRDMNEITIIDFMYVLCCEKLMIKISECKIFI